MPISARKLHDFFRDQSEICDNRIVYDIEGLRVVFVLENNNLNFRISFSAVQAIQVRDEMYALEFSPGTGIDGVGLYEISGGSFIQYTKGNSGAWPKESKQYTVVSALDWVDVLCCQEPVVEVFRANDPAALDALIGTPD